MLEHMGEMKFNYAHSPVQVVSSRETNADLPGDHTKRNVATTDESIVLL